MEEDFTEPMVIPIEGELDLHTFRPKDVKMLLPDYLEACREESIYEVRIIHGKGTGQLRRLVHSILDKNPLVESYRLDSGRSSWGCTLAVLKKD